MFTKILIANRGEIACRVIRTAKRMGIATVAVYSEADASARHVRLADEAVAIGPAPARQSYLAGEKIVDAALRTGAEAIHPGYGFLSENEAFAEACGRAGLVFIGPPVAAIRAMGSKSAAKALMEKAGVPLTPGYHGDDQDPALLRREADAIGYPVLIKASAGGGGKGMRRVDAGADFDAALASCKREAQSSFGDDRVLVEKYVTKPRHIEIQVFGDTQGNVVHLFERDCSVQRRHQKVLEEAPAPGMTDARRAAMGQAAVEAAKAVGYVGAGTVEFIANQDGSFYFMEMNTRLQVEHPVTEMITGLDLVEWQLKVAAGEPLPLAQDALTIRGHALEARIYAEDPDRGFLPSTGRLVHLSTPAPTADVRIDTGVEAGDSITPFYDPMIAKLIVHGADRDEALRRMRAALADYRIVGVANNVAFLDRLVATRSFATADLDTGLIEREHDALFATTAEPSDDDWTLAALLVALDERRAAAATADASTEPGSPWNAQDGWRLNGRAARAIALIRGDARRTVRLVATGDGFDASVADADGDAASSPPTASVVPASGRLAGDGAFDAIVGQRRRRGHLVAVGARRHVFADGRAWTFDVDDGLDVGGHHGAHHGGLKAPMPGKVVALLAAAGAVVEAGAPLVVLEAMKMEHTITAPGKGTVKAFHFAPGDQVPDGADLVDFETVG